MLDGIMRELVPMLAKVSTSLDHVNEELDKVGRITDSATDATAKVDATVRSVSEAVSKPFRAFAGLHGRDLARLRRLPQQAQPARRCGVKRALAVSVGLSAAATALYKRAQALAETEQRPVGDVLRDMPGRISADLRTLPDDLRVAAQEGREAAGRKSAEVEDDYRRATEWCQAMNISRAA